MNSGVTGPLNWAKIAPTCAGHRQSPINSTCRAPMSNAVQLSPTMKTLQLKSMAF